ncbi:MAG: tetratricopeptide repeat protein [Candidatus Hydrogenedentes bacterium]|nr:tetratricopeptide repeat protein [Candidatus Hydrogenedentota bacterium]
MPGLKTWGGVGLIAVLAIFSGVQTYRVRELGLRLASLPPPAPASSPIVLSKSKEPKAEKPSTDEKNAAVKDGATKPEADAEKVAEETLKQERERLRKALGTIGDNAAKAAGTEGKQGAPSKDAGKAPAVKSAADGKPDKDKSAVQKAANQTSVNDTLIRAQTLMEKGSYDDAVTILKDGLQGDPANRNLNLTLAGLYHRLHQYDAEVQTYLDWSTSAPGEALPHFEAAQAYAVLGKSPEALQQLTNFLDMTQQSNKRDMTVYPMVASVYRQLGMSSDEGAVLQTWAQQAPEEIEVQRELANYYSRTGDTQSALVEYQAIAQRLPNDADAHRNLASAYSRASMNPEAEAELTTAVGLQPQNLNTRLQLANLYRQSQQLDAALQTCTDIVNVSPNSAEGQQAQQIITQIQAQRPNTQSPR